MTNGEILLKTFPNLKPKFFTNLSGMKTVDVDFGDETYYNGTYSFHTFSKEWWESEYIKNLIKPKEEDEIYLLSIDEYNGYKEKIPVISTWWWLRSPGLNSLSAADVFNDGSVRANGNHVSYEYSVRPALRYANLKSKISESFKGEGYFLFNEVRWKIIDTINEIAIAELPIGFEKFDDNSNDYDHSYIRQWLLDWIAD